MSDREKRVVRFRKALEQIRDYEGRYEDYMDQCSNMKDIAREILREADNENSERG